MEHLTPRPLVEFYGGPMDGHRHDLDASVSRIPVTGYGPRPLQYTRKTLTLCGLPFDVYVFDDLEPGRAFIVAADGTALDVVTGETMTVEEMAWKRPPPAAYGPR